MSQTSHNQQIIQEHLDAFPGLQKLTLAKLLVNKYPLNWASLDTCRAAIRRECGQQGELSRKHKADKSRFGPPGDSTPLCFIPPAIQELDWSPYFLQTGTTLVMSDLHFPFHDPDAILKAIEYVHNSSRYTKIDTILINGDGCDFYRLSRFDKTPSLARFHSERDSFVIFLLELRRIFPDAKIVWKMGNHEERWEMYMLAKAPEIFDLLDNKFSFETLFDFKEIGNIERVTDKRLIMAGELAIVHAHEFEHGIAAPVNPARGFFLRAKDNVMGSHHHQTSSHAESTIRGKIIGAWSTGCLCQLHPKYKVINKWNLGFAVVESAKREFEVHNYKIIKNKVYRS